MLRRLIAAGIAALPASNPAWAQDSTPNSPVIVSGFVDVYYAYDFGRPTLSDRAYTTQAVRHNEANVNLAFATLAVERGRARAKLTLQAGTSVQSNYASEPSAGPTSGPLLARHIQEAYAGIRLAPRLWLDAGISLGSLGWEGWISRDNPTYTRSLVAEFSPYYESGIRVVWEAGPRLLVQGHIMNGWQRISDDNDAKSASVRVDVVVAPGVTVAAASFIGNEQPRESARSTRFFNQIMVKANPRHDVLLQGQVDVGRQLGPGGDAAWWGAVAIARLSLERRFAVVLRVERFADPDQVVALTGGPAGLEVNGGSVGIDAIPSEGLLWRTELRGFRASERVFPRGAGSAAGRSNTALVTSFAVTL